ncbi:MAG: hypothetical protein ACREVE_16130, partial [Gammaproteobacteria bacterium]
VAQGDPLQRAEGVTRRERARRGRDQRVHRNPVTLVTPTVSLPVPILSHDHQPTRGIENGATNHGEKIDDDTQDRKREEWLAARLELLEAEKELTRRSTGNRF